jgi:TPR repeat protein
LSAAKEIKPIAKMKINHAKRLPLIVLLLAVVNLSAQQPNSDSKMIGELKNQAEQGDAKAQCSLGLIYCNGEGVTKDYIEALKWLRKAADQGDAKAEYNRRRPKTGWLFQTTQTTGGRWFRFTVVMAQSCFAFSQFTIP